MQLDVAKFKPRNQSPRGDAELVVNEQHFSRIVLNGICRAEVSLDIMTADLKAMLVPDGVSRHARSIVAVLRSLAQKGVEVRLLHAGVPSAPALAEMKRALKKPALSRGLTIRRCPRLHAKAIIIDARRMYLGSANMTGAGLGAKADARRNFELGIWTESAPLIDPVLEQFNTLWEGRLCDGCCRRDVCPVPLEEPSL
ncbi:hypothetical protein BH09PLA1_BH09PLA1_25190 [soil metagenome]